VTVTRPPVVAAPLIEAWEGTVAGAVHRTGPPLRAWAAARRVAWFTLTL